MQLSHMQQPDRAAVLSAHTGRSPTHRGCKGRRRRGGRARRSLSRQLVSQAGAGGRRLLPDSSRLHRVRVKSAQFSFARLLYACPEPVLANHRLTCPEPVLANHR